MKALARFGGWLGAMVLLMGVAGNLRAASTEWHRWRGPDLNGISKERMWTTAWPAAGPRVLWKASVGTGFSSVSAAGGRVFTMGNDADRESVFCFEAGTGRQVWKYTYSCELDPRFYEGGPSATPTVDGANVYTLSRKGHLLCFDAATGRVNWQTNVNDELGLKKFKEETPEWGYAGSPLVLGNMLIVNVGTAGAAFEKATGRLIWRTGGTAAGYSTHVPGKVGRSDVLVVAAAKSIVALGAKDGKTLWEFPWVTSYDVNAADPIVVGNKVFISSGYGRGCALLQFNGSLVSKIWENKNLRNQFNASVLYGGHLYGFDGNHGDKNSSLRCVDFETGKLKWIEPTVKPGALMVADGRLIIVAENGELIVAPVSASAFQPVARAQVLGGKCWTVPVLHNARIYCRNSRGDLVCLDVQGRPVPVPNPAAATP